MSEAGFGPTTTVDDYTSDVDFGVSPNSAAGSKGLHLFSLDSAALLSCRGLHNDAWSRRVSN